MSNLHFAFIAAIVCTILTVIPIHRTIFMIFSIALWVVVLLLVFKGGKLL